MAALGVQPIRERINKIHGTCSANGQKLDLGREREGIGERKERHLPIAA